MINNILKQSTKISDVVFKCSSYDALDIPANSIIYCDPPYNGTTKYKDSFDSDAFWQWCRDKVKEGHTVYVSEYNAPEDFKCIWEKQINSNLGNTAKTATEKLFTIWVSIISWLSVLYALNGRKVTVWILIRYEKVNI